MSFVQPLFLAGLLAASLPIIIHLINRRKAVHRPFPALKLLRESNEKIARSVKMRQWLLLALRVLVIAAVAIALAKPYVLSSDGMTAEERLPNSVVFVVENGVAMEHSDWFEQATDEFRSQVRSLRPWDEATLMSTADDRLLLAGPSTEHGNIRRASSDLEIRQRPGSIADALLAADQLLAGSDLPNRRIVLIGSGTDSAVESHRDIHLNSPVEYIDVSGTESAENMAVTNVDFEQQGAARDGRWKIDADITNFGHSDQSDIGLQLRIEDQIVATTTLDVAAGESTSYSFDHSLADPRLTEGVVELTDSQGLDADDRYHFLIRPQHRVRALLVNGSPSSIPYDDELFFFVRALEPGAESGTGISPSITTPEGMDRRDLSDFDVVVLANVSRLSGDHAEQLHRFVEQGGGLFISMGDEVDIEAYNQQLSALLPRPLRGKKLLAERDDPDAPVKTTRLGHPQRHHPIFQTFHAPGGGSLQSVSVYSYMLLDPAPSERDAEPILSYQDNAPALLERRVGQGRVLLFTTSVDRDWTDFPVRSSYLPLLNRSLLHLARRATSATDDEYFVGEPLELDVGDLVSRRAIIHDPEGGRIVLEPTDGRVTFTPRTAGTYSFFADDDGDESGHLIDSLTLSANVDRSGSSLAPFSTELLDDWQGQADGETLAGDSNQERRLNMWSKFLFAVILILLVETVLGSRRSVLLRTFRKLTFWRDDEPETPTI